MIYQLLILSPVCKSRAHEPGNSKRTVEFDTVLACCEADVSLLVLHIQNFSMFTQIYCSK